jgi:endonuclease/exonuclease/phosphatase family metal-dependent hydrolase
MPGHRPILWSLPLLCALFGCQPAGWTQPGAKDDGGAVDAQPPADAAGAVEVSVMALNLHCLKLDGTPYASNPARMAAVADAVAAEGIAALALQEVCKNPREDGMALLVAELQRATGTAWTGKWIKVHDAWVGTPDQAEEGIAVLARGATTNPQEIVYSAQSGLLRKSLGMTLSGLDDLRLFTVHLEVSDALARATQARETASFAVTTADPSLDVVVAGDFNDVEGSAAHGAMTTYDFADFSAGQATTRIDHVFVHRGAAWELVANQLILDGNKGARVTDHPGGVVAKLRKRIAPSAVRTRFVVSQDVGFGNQLYLRGSSAPLSWAWGWKAVNVTPPLLWKLVLTGYSQSAAFEYKWLRNDRDWQLGGNESGVGGRDNPAQPRF